MTGPRRGAHARLDRVTFGYGAGAPVLDRVSMELRPDQVTCLTGPSGAGKSSLLALLIRLAEPQSGSIVIDGHDIADVPLARLRQLVTIVPQEPWLHTGTLGENIRYGNPQATRAEVLTAAHRAGVNAFAGRLPHGYDFDVGEHGLRLSGGQRRRVAVARALLRDAPLLLLDEPTTGLDPAAEADLITGLIAAATGKTVLLVTHQPRLVELADQVMRLGDGRITIARCDARQGQGTLRYQRFQWTTSSNGRRLGLASGRSGLSAG
jgi:ATP-binding cassette subfamily B protein